MQIEMAESLLPMLKHDGENLQVQAQFYSEEDILARYLNHGFGNAYNFDQTDRLEEHF